VTSIFGTGATLQADINLILQIVTLIMIFISLGYKSKNKFKIHGGLMGIAIILLLVSLFAVMFPSLSSNYEYLTTSTSELGVQTAWVHASLGIITLILGIFLVTAWALKTSNITACMRRKRIMDITVLFWIISLVFGIATYIAFYA
jgi:uncharacterized membrane protein YozB (DUF420 family)